MLLFRISVSYRCIDHVIQIGCQFIHLPAMVISSIVWNVYVWKITMNMKTDFLTYEIVQINARFAPCIFINYGIIIITSK